MTKKQKQYAHPIYNKDLVSRSIEALQSLSNPLREIDLIDAANRAYKNGYSADDFERYNNALNHPLIKCFKERLVAGLHNDWTEQLIDKTDGTVDLLPHDLAMEYAKYESQGLWLESNQLLVPVRTASLSHLSEFIDKNIDPWIINKPYSPVVAYP